MGALRCRKCSSIASAIRRPIDLPLVPGSTPRTSIQPVGSSRPNSPERTSPSMKPTTLPSGLGDEGGVGVPPQVITDPALPNFRPVAAADLLVDGDDVADVQLVERADGDPGRGLSHSLAGTFERSRRAPCDARHKRHWLKVGGAGARGRGRPQVAPTTSGERLSWSEGCRGDLRSPSFRPRNRLSFPLHERARRPPLPESSAAAPPAPGPAPVWRVHLTLILVQAAFGGFHVVAKAVLADLAPLALAAIRVGLATPILMALAWRRDRFLPARRDLPDARPARRARRLRQPGAVHHRPEASRRRPTPRS